MRMEINTAFIANIMEVLPKIKNKTIIRSVILFDEYFEKINEPLYSLQYYAQLPHYGNNIHVY